MMTYQIKQAETDAEFEQYFHLRWRILSPVGWALPTIAPNR